MASIFPVASVKVTCNLSGSKWIQEQSKSLLDDTIESELIEAFEEFQISDPAVGRWTSWGFVSPAQFAGSPMYMIPGGWIMAVERRDRILPTTVIKSEVMKEVAGRDLSRIEIAELKSNVVDRLLAQALIKSKVIYLIVQSEYVYVTTGSDKEFGDVLYFVQDCLPNFVTATPEVFPQKWMRAKMFGDCDDVVSNMFKLQPTFTLKDSEGSKIAITDWTVEREALDEWLAQATPVAMSLAYTIDEDPILDFVLTDKFTIKSLTFMGGVDDVGTIEDFPGTAMIVTNTLNQVFPKLIALTAIEDDEL